MHLYSTVQLLSFFIGTYALTFFLHAATCSAEGCAISAHLNAAVWFGATVSFGTEVSLAVKFGEIAEPLPELFGATVPLLAFAVPAVWAMHPKESASIANIIEISIVLYMALFGCAAV
jgi:hypothetical protein